MPIQTLHLRSSVQGKEPVAGSATGQLPVGSIGINFNSAEPFLTIQDSAGNIRRIAGIKVDAAAPATPTAGEAWLDTTIATKPVFKVYDGAAWQGAGSSTSTGNTAPATPTQGDLWVDTSVPGSPVLKVYNGTAWVAVAPDASETVKGVVELATVAEAEAGTDTVRAVTPAGLKAGIIKISGGASSTAPSTPTTGQIWTDTSKSPPVVNVWDGTKWVEVGATPADATTTTKGIVQLADAAAVTAGTAGRVVTADQLKATNDAVATAAGGGLADAPDGTAAGTLQYVRQVVTTGTTGSFTQTKSWAAASLADASETVKGVIELATAAEVLAGTDAVRAVTPKELKDHYIAKNIALLTALP